MSSWDTTQRRQNFLQHKNDILKKAGIPKLQIHDLRHTAVAILLAQGVYALCISELPGHSSVAFTLHVYGHLMEETKRETAARMEDALVIPMATSVAPLCQYQ